MLTFLWVMHLNVGYNNIFLCHGGKDCVRKQPSYVSSPSYFAAFPQTPYFYYSKVHVVGFLQHFELEGLSNCEISRWVSRWSVFVRRCSYVALKELAHGMVCTCLSESRLGLTFRDVISLWSPASQPNLLLRSHRSWTRTERNQNYASFSFQLGTISQIYRSIEPTQDQKKQNILFWYLSQFFYFKELYILPHSFSFFVHLTFRQNSIFWFEKSDLISADTLNYLDWIGFKKEFFPLIRYLRRSFTNELSCT